VHGFHPSGARLVPSGKDLRLPRFRFAPAVLIYSSLFCVYGIRAQVVQVLPHYDQASRERGKTAFGAACSFCHGGNARGGQGGPDLLHSVVVLQDEEGKQLGEFLQKGRPDRGMPSFAGLTQGQASDIATFLHAEVLAAVAQRSVQVDIVTGDAKRGEEFFRGQGKCSECHSINGDLKGIGSKYEPIALQDKIVSPRGPGVFGGGPPGSQPVAIITLPSGESVTGSILRINLFDVTIRDAKGVRRTFARDGDVPKVEVRDPLKAHIDNLFTLTDQQMHDLTAYLVTLK
jgi:cytochrome c oxidase cbb3-type subunit 3